MSLVKILKVVLINILVFFALILLIEGGLWSARYILGRHSVGYLFNTESSKTHPCRRMKTHPILSHVHDTRNECKPKGGAAGDHFVFYNSNSNQPVIVTLGGSTTSGFYQHFSDGHTWPLFLEGIVSKKGYQVINGGVGGYSSSQELLKLITEVRRLRNVKLVISFNGINETPFYPGGEVKDINTKYPFLKFIQYRMILEQRWIDQRMVDAVWLPNINSFIRFVVGKSLHSKIPGFTPSNNNLSNYFKVDNKFKPIEAPERWFAM
jgi:hypothetical protein